MCNVIVFLNILRQKYDREYIEYIKTIVEALPKYGLRCIIDAHQDVFSRLTGGSGAPGWVLETLGFSMRTLHDSHAAHLHSLALDPSKDPPPSVWPTGYQKLAAATCNTVFWAGDIFAYKLRAPDGSGRGLSSFLQEAMVNAFGELADALEDCEAVLGFEVRSACMRSEVAGRSAGNCAVLMNSCVLTRLAHERASQRVPRAAQPVHL